jgi:hypothetical protein
MNWVLQTGGLHLDDSNKYNGQSLGHRLAANKCAYNKQEARSYLQIYVFSTNTLMTEFLKHIPVPVYHQVYTFRL